MGEQNVINSIIKAKKQAKNALGYHTERIPAAISPTNVQRRNRGVSVIPEISSKRIRLGDI